MVEIPCWCGHQETIHKFRIGSVEEWFRAAIQSGTLVAHHSPELFAPIAYTNPYTGARGSYEDIVKSAIELRDFHSICLHKSLFSRCKCRAFKPDNLSYIEQLAKERGLV